jgi:hypothetical protein
MAGAEFDLIYAKRPWTVNAQRRWHHYKIAGQVKEWREAFAALANLHNLPTPVLEPVIVYATPILRDQRLQDVGACLPAVKAAIDGLCDAGVLTGDGPAFVEALVFNAPQVDPGGRDGLLLTIVASDGAIG